MTEGTPIQDPSIPDSVPTPETPQDNFGIENRYSPEVLYTLLTKDYRSHGVRLTNNLYRINEPGYDPIDSINTIVYSEVKAKYDLSNDRFSKFFRFESKFNLSWGTIYHSCLHFGSKEELVKQLGSFQETLNNQDIDTTLLNIESFQKNRGKETDDFPFRHINPYYTYYLVSKQDSQFHLAIEVDGLSKENEIVLMSPWPGCDLNSIEIFANAQQEHFVNLERVIKAIYQTTKKDLPPVKLQFKPEEEKSSEFFATCSYCARQYFAAQDPTCPGCGASSPRFIINIQ